METIGNISYDLNNDSILINVMMALDFYFNQDALKIMSDQLMTNVTVNAPKNIDASAYQRGLTELVGKDKADKIITDLNLYGAFKKVPEELQHTLLLTDIKLVWNKTDRTFQSSGSMGINIIEKNYINRYVNGTLEIAYKRTGNSITLYLPLENKSWFYFNYSRGLMQSISSINTFNDALDKVKPEKRAKKEKDKPDYEYTLSTDRAVKNFLRKLSAQTEPPKEEEK
jgi:hypothetical protein